MGKDIDWYEQAGPGGGAASEWYRGTEPPPPGPAPTPSVGPTGRQRRRIRPYVVAIVALSLTLVAVWQHAEREERAAAYKEQVAAYKGLSATSLTIGGVEVETLAEWSKNGRSVILSARVYRDDTSKFVRISSGGRTAEEEVLPLQPGEFSWSTRVEVKVPVEDRFQPVRMSVMAGGPGWKKGTRLAARNIEFHSDYTAFDADTGERLKQD
ncbi:hypothetical protein BJP40_06010 [Streptomyces sp. CC53]|uniref:hypothetical protein n=1 Tax=Streptomyces sp. CC53 TaxID=1906740 RepID=UPI0008DE554C|nr:hypothetical protein [Streptomyces sp. CC53]OII61325.1 hypothetical protein BJP40_06010 [Streptomyces sp. CC53]